MPHRFKNLDLKRTLASLDKETIYFFEQKQRERNERDFRLLFDNLKVGKCSLCGCYITDVDENKPCLHWLINPSINKKLLRDFLSKPHSFFKLYTYLAWVANTENPYVNINDTFDFDTDKKIFEVTIRYRNIEWSFSLGRNDFDGHKDSFKGGQSHYHAQLKIDGRVQIKYNQTHIPFVPSDFLNFEILKQGAMVIDHSFAAGTEELKRHVQVNHCEDGCVVFIQLVSSNTIRITIVKSGITQNQIFQIREIFEKTDFEISEIIDKLNEEYNYSIKYCVYECHRDDPIEKNSRH